MSRHLHSDEIVFKHDFYVKEKFDRAGIAATGLFVCAVAHSHAHDSDGFIRERDLAALGNLTDLGITEGAITGLYTPATLEALASRLVEAGLFHRVPGGFQIHDYADYQETTLSRQMRRLTNAQRQKRRRTGHTLHGRDMRATSAHSPSARASEPLGSRSKFSISGSDHRGAADDSKKALETADYGSDLEPYLKVASGLRGADPRTPIVLGSVLRGQPEVVLATALERLDARRRKAHLAPIVNEAKYLVATVREVIAERRAAA